MLLRFDPFRELDQMANGSMSGRRTPSMAMDAFRQGDTITVRLDLPGVDRDSIDITVEKNQLIVSAERSWKPDDDTQVVAAERPQGSFTRTLLLGDGLDTDRIDADYEHGVLTLSIPVAETAKPRKISVGSSSQAALAS